MQYSFFTSLKQYNSRVTFITKGKFHHIKVWLESSEVKLDFGMICLFSYDRQRSCDISFTFENVQSWLQST